MCTYSVRSCLGSQKYLLLLYHWLCSSFRPLPLQLQCRNVRRKQRSLGGTHKAEQRHLTVTTTGALRVCDEAGPLCSHRFLRGPRSDKWCDFAAWEAGHFPNKNIPSVMQRESFPSFLSGGVGQCSATGWGRTNKQTNRDMHTKRWGYNNGEAWCDVMEFPINFDTTRTMNHFFNC